MRKLISSMSGGQKGFTLIELLVVIAILGVIAAIVALNVSTFFGRGTLQAANTELHQVQTAVISLMADAESGVISLPGGATNATWWPGGSDLSPHFETQFYASDYVYGPFRATYLVDINGNILSGWASAADDDKVPGGYPVPTLAQQPGNAWTNIYWDPNNKNWSSTNPTP